MSKSKFAKQASSLYRVVLLQRGFKLVVRAAWMGGAGYILGWGVHEIWGLFPSPSHWLMVGGGLAVVNLAAIFFPPIPLKAFLWKLDSKLEFNQQFSTAAEVEDELNSVNQALIEDALGLIPNARRRIIDKGWDLRKEFESGVVVLILLLIIYLTGVGSLPTTIPGGIGILPGAGTNPSFADVFPSGIPGDSDGAGFFEGQNQGLAYEISSESVGEIGEVLRELGRELNSQAGTSELGQGLERGDLDQASEKFSQLAGNVDQMSEETLENLADSLESAADKLTGADQQELADRLRDAANSIRNGDSGQIGEDLDSLAEILSDLGALTGEQLAANNDGLSGASPSGSSNSSPFDRLEGEGGGISLGQNGSSQYLQTSGPGSGQAGDTADGSYDYLSPTDGTIIEGGISPYNLPWIFKDVISSYFTP